MQAFATACASMTQAGVKYDPATLAKSYHIKGIPDQPPPEQAKPAPPKPFGGTDAPKPDDAK